MTRSRFAALIFGGAGYFGALLLAALLAPNKPLEPEFIAVFGIVAGALTARRGGLVYVVLGAEAVAAGMGLHMFVHSYMPTAFILIYVFGTMIADAMIIGGLGFFAANVTTLFLDRHAT